MLKRTASRAWQGIELGPSMVGLKLKNQHLLRHSLFSKEYAKWSRYTGSWLLRHPDRDMQYANSLGPTGSRKIVRRDAKKAQYLSTYEKIGKYRVNTWRRFDNIWTLAGAGVIGFEVWCGAGYASDAQSYIESVKMKNMTKDCAVNMAENYGLKHIILDEYTQPWVEDFKYWKHNLYQNNFPYLSEPVTGPGIGDPDWTWKGEDKIDYTNYGASHKSPYNRFRPSLFEPLRKLAVPVPKAAAPAAKGKKAATKA